MNCGTAQTFFTARLITQLLHALQWILLPNGFANISRESIVQSRFRSAPQFLHHPPYHDYITSLTRALDSPDTRTLCFQN
ncbi:hypothetical protein PMAYCL1PPCAC_22100 [Pristionchus mayeri]|uniref:G protein-coupled receptor n=1 Tax=Pristionchus mayeri TaxID=1317129 RepID=A0AAN5CWS1_9BILA|nr:hypothetical protein PMAYCL1PPCAC_22100 [Pristionchus mayeri]